MTDADNNTTVLAGDIGGTKTNLGLFIKGTRRPLLKTIETYSSQEAPDLEHIIDKFLKKHKVAVASGCFGVAGPVLHGRCKITNLPWDVSEARIKRRFKWGHVRLINDLAATALAIPLLNSREFLSLSRAKARKGENLALVAPGTGLGQALLIFQDGKYVPVPSEGGHGDFSPNSEAEVRLWRFLHERHDHVSVERVVSGLGLRNIYSWLKDSGQYGEPEWLTKRFSEMDPARAISEAAINDNDPLCVATLDMFVSTFGAVSGNLALTGMTTGGVYLGGGICPKILPKLKDGIFMKAFLDKGRSKGLLEKIPVRVVLNDRAALLGAGQLAFEIIDQEV
jgi:glucokinase